MNVTISFIRSFFICLSILFLTIYTTSTFEGGLNSLNLILGIGLGLVFGFSFMVFEYLFKNVNLKSFVTAMIGLFLGYLMGECILIILNSVLDISSLNISSASVNLIRVGIFLFSTYLSMTLTARALEEFHINIPFIKFKGSHQQKGVILLDTSVLLDPRLIDLATSGLLDQRLIIPQFTVKELNSGLESHDEAIKAKARRGLEVLKKLENMTALGIQYNNTDYNDLSDSTSKLIRLARLLDANIFTADISKIQHSFSDGVKLINIHTLSNALKPISQTGETLVLKVQRYGKEPRQGVGYLDDGTMVVINGGAEFIGETIKVQVLSVKHTTSGRMIFCNANEDLGFGEQELVQSVVDMENSQKNYFAL